MLLFNCEHKSHHHEKVLEKRIEHLQQRIKELERQAIAVHRFRCNSKKIDHLKHSSVLLLPVNNLSEQEESPKANAGSSSSIDVSGPPIMIVESSSFQIFESVV